MLTKISGYGSRATADKDYKKEKNKTVTPVKIDLDQMYKRQVQVTSWAGGEFVKGFSKDGREIFEYFNFCARKLSE